MAKININLPAFSQKQIGKFWGNVDKSPGQGPKGDCWQWQGQTWRKYGRATFRNEGKTRNYRAHRLAFCFSSGYSPVNLVCHHCDNPPCCNPAHLFEGTQVDNMQDAKQKGRTYRSSNRPRSPKQLKLRLGRVVVSRPDLTRRYALKDFTPNPSPRLNGVGENHVFAKLNNQTVRSIRAEYADGTDGPTLARKYRVHRATIRDIVLRRSWNHV